MGWREGTSNIQHPTSDIERGTRLRSELPPSPGFRRRCALARRDGETRRRGNGGMMGAGDDCGQGGGTSLIPPAVERAFKRNSVTNQCLQGFCDFGSVTSGHLLRLEK